MTAESDRLRQGASLAQSGQFEEAKTVFEEILRENPNHVEALFLKGACHYKLGDTIEAASAWNRVLAIDPNHAKAQGMLAKIPPVGAVPTTPLPPPPEPPAAASPPKRTEKTRSRKYSLNLKTIAAVAILLVLAGFGADMFLNPGSYPFLRKEAVDLQWKWNAGQLLIYSGTVNQSIDISGPPGEGGAPSQISNMSIGEKMAFNLKLNVREVDPTGVAAISASYEDMNVQVDVPQMPGMGEMAGEINRLLREALSVVEGKAFTLRIDSQGKILECSGMDEISQAVSASLGENSPLAQMGENPSELFGNEVTKKNQQLLFGELPSGPVPIGTSWTGSLSGQTVPPFETTFKQVAFTLEGKETVAGEDCGKVQQQFDLALDQDLDLPQIPMGEGMNIELKETRGSGVLFFSETNQRLVRSESTIEAGISMKMTLPPPFGAGGEISMNMNMKVDNRLELTSIGSAGSNVVASVDSGPSSGAATSPSGETSLEEGLSGKWFFLFEGSPSEFNFFPNGKLAVTINREGGVSFKLDGNYKIEGNTVVFEVNTPEGPAEVKAYNAKIVGPNFTFNYDDPDGPKILAERR